MNHGIFRVRTRCGDEYDYQYALDFTEIQDADGDLMKLTHEEFLQPPLAGTAYTYTASGAAGDPASGTAKTYDVQDYSGVEYYDYIRPFKFDRRYRSSGERLCPVKYYDVYAVDASYGERAIDPATLEAVAPGDPTVHLYHSSWQYGAAWGTYWGTVGAAVPASDWSDPASDPAGHVFRMDHDE